MNLMIRGYEENDEIQILKLFELVYNRKMNLDFWNWRFKNNPFGFSPQINLMFDQELLVGHYAVFPIKLIYNGKIFDSALSMTTMTHPSYEGKGIFTKLASDLYSKLNFENFSSIIGFPNSNSHYAFINKLNWVDNFVIPTLKLDINKLEPEFDYTSHSDFNKLNFVKINKPEEIGILKDLNYLNWRYLNCPVNSYQILEIGHTGGFVILKLYKNGEQFEIDILENTCDSDFDSFKKSIQCVAGFVQQENLNVSFINIWCNLKLKKHGYLEKIGFSQTLPLTYFSMLNLNNISNSLDFNANFNVTFGDSDIY